MYAVVTICACLLVLLQGGFYAASYCLVGVLFGLSALILGRKAKITREHIALLVLFFLYLLSALINGISVESVSVVCILVTCLLFSLALSMFENQKRERLLQDICVFSAALALISLMDFSGLFSLPGFVDANRLLSTLQYANVAGTWFAVMSIVGLESQQRWPRMLAPLNIVALLLTQSVGAIGLFVIFEVLLMVRVRGEGTWRWRIIVLGTSTIISAAIILVPPMAAKLLCLLLLLAFCYWQESLKIVLLKVKSHLIFVAAMLLTSPFVLTSGRLQEASQTFIERLIQINDGFAIMAAHPFFGVGPGNWQYYYKAFQSAQYDTSVVHSSYLQIGVSAGFLALAAILILAGLCIWRMRAYKPEYLAGALLILLHSLFDFCLLYASIDILLISLVLAGDSTGGERELKPFMGRVVSLCLIAVCTFGFYCSLQLSTMKQAVAEGNFNEAQTIYEHNGMLSSNSFAIRDEYYQALASHGNWEDIISRSGGKSFLTDRALTARVIALGKLDRQDEAFDLLLGSLKSQPFDKALFDWTKSYIQTVGGDESVARSYDEAVDDANLRIAQGLAQYLKGQEVLKYI